MQLYCTLSFLLVTKMYEEFRRISVPTLPNHAWPKDLYKGRIALRYLYHLVFKNRYKWSKSKLSSRSGDSKKGIASGV
jgi:hypothetical protein